MSRRLWLLDLTLRAVEKPYLARVSDVQRARARMERLARVLAGPRDPAAREAVLSGPGGSVPALRLAIGGTGVLLWLHGGAYCIGSPRTHLAMVAALARRAGLDAVLPAYRLAPEHPFPAAIEDALLAYRALLGEGVLPGRIGIGGDSAGGGLALALLHVLLELDLPAPGAVVAFSPWADLTLSGSSIAERARRDAMLPAGRLSEVRDLYLAGADPRDPRASPVFGAFAGGPRVLVQCSDAEILHDDAVRVVERLRAQGVEAVLDEWSGTPHVWQLFHGALPEARGALDRAAAFLRAAMPVQKASR